MEDLTGQRLDGYELLRLLGRGAMASVYLAEQASLDRRVAIKVLKAELCRDADYVARFQHEARAAASMSHAGIVQVYEVGSASIDGEPRHYIAQEYVPGGTLGRLLEREGSLTPGRVLGVLWQVASALAAAAEKGLVHRDIKPDNLMIDRSGAVKVADFGLARAAEPGATKLTQAGVALGTPLYMSPEQIEGDRLDSRSDFYSLGVTAYQLLVGEPPFKGDAPLAVALQHLNQPPKPITQRRPGVPPLLAAIIERLLAKKPSERVESPAELLGELRSLARHAEREGWAEESLDPAASTLLSGTWMSNEAAAESVKELGEAMREETSSGKKNRKNWKRRAMIVLVAILVGIVGGSLFSPDSLVANSRGLRVERAQDVRTQLYLAKLADTPAAWRAINEYFPDADPFFQVLSLRGYSICVLRRGWDREAVASLQELLALAGQDEQFSAVAYEGLVIANSRLGREEQARSARSRITNSRTGPNGRPTTALEVLAPDLNELLLQAMRELDRSQS